MKLGYCLSLATLLAPSHGFAPNDASSRGLLSSMKSTAMPDLTFTNPDTTGIEEQACIDAANKMKRVAVPVSAEVSSEGSVGISYIHWEAEKPKAGCPPLILIHGFDSSGLEYRRLGPKLAAKGIDTYAVDILGWGFTQLEGVDSFSAAAKVEALGSFVDSVVGKGSFCVGGASLGGASAIEFAALRKSDCTGLVLIDAQGFVDGIGPMASMPKPLAKLGVGVLKSIPLRNSANQMSYFDKETFATEEAQVIGRLHCLRDGWDDAMVSYMQSGGFYPSKKVPTIESPTLVLWGRQDGILDGEEFANKFVEEMPNASLKWIEECGHVPHLEQPDETAEAILSFLTSEVGARQRNVEDKPPLAIGVGAGFISVLAISQLAAAIMQ
ncbi:unnamed protein product [Cylindrotheca closterium]|uniref:AB hydrolase-1 domain-containing protein n=1 Tax=Cylindrotheca closterium TaxID=2856 RepID=A0AAD2CRI4_9STRA|nr:unnamed protein product [Cylindrotheca closterium]